MFCFRPPFPRAALVVSIADKSKYQSSRPAPQMNITGYLTQTSDSLQPETRFFSPFEFTTGVTSTAECLQSCSGYGATSPIQPRRRDVYERNVKNGSTGNNEVFRVPSSLYLTEHNRVAGQRALSFLTSSKAARQSLSLLPT